MNAELLDYFQKLFSISLGAIGTWLALRSFYEKRNQETLDRYAGAQQKAYAAERDFEHLRRNQEQMKEAFKMLDGELAETREDVREIKGMMVAIFGKIGDVSGIFGKREG